MKFELYTLIIESFLSNIPGFSFAFESGYGNGYVLIPKDHPYYGVDYNNIDVDIHGGLTYGSYFKSEDFLKWCKDREISGDITLVNYKNFEDFWMIGFDTCHYGDNRTNWTKEDVIQETDKLLEKCLDDSIKKIRNYKTKILRKNKLLRINNI